MIPYTASISFFPASVASNLSYSTPPIIANKIFFLPWSSAFGHCLIYLLVRISNVAHPSTTYRGLPLQSVNQSKEWANRNPSISPKAAILRLKNNCYSILEHLTLKLVSSQGLPGITRHFVFISSTSTSCLPLLQVPLSIKWQADGPKPMWNTLHSLRS